MPHRVSWPGLQPTRPSPLIKRACIAWLQFVIVSNKVVCDTQHLPPGQKELLTRSTSRDGKEEAMSCMGFHMQPVNAEHYPGQQPDPHRRSHTLVLPQHYNRPSLIAIDCFIRAGKHMSSHLNECKKTHTYIIIRWEGSCIHQGSAAVARCANSRSSCAWVQHHGGATRSS
jgi:hypothetical protein